MKRKMMTLAGLACAGALALSWNSSRAQSDPTSPAAPAAPQNQNAPAAPAEPRQPSPPPRPRGRPGPVFQRTLFSLQQTKLELQKATNDFDGHRTLALDACDKAITELEAVMQSAGIPPMQQMRRPPMRPQPAAPAPAPSAAPAAPPSQQ